MCTPKPIVKALFLLLFSVTLAYTARAFSFSAVASSGQVLYYNILSDSTVEVTYPGQAIGLYYNGYQKPAGDLVIPTSVTYSGNTYQVVSVGDNAFHSCEGLTALTIPNTVATIGSSACSQCTGLAMLTLGGSVYSIGDNAFMGCTSLLSLDVPNSVTMIGVGSFQGCSGLHTISLGSSVCTIGNVAFEGCSAVASLVIPNSVALVGNWAFCNLTSLDSLYIGSSITYFLPNTFAGTNNVRYLHYNAKNANVSSASRSALPIGRLSLLVVGDSVQTIQQYSFAGANELDSVYLGRGLTSVDSSAFNGCANVRYLNYNSEHFSDRTFPASALNVFCNLTNLVVGDNVSRIPAKAFCQKDSLRSVILSNAVDTIGDSCFYGCAQLTSIRWPNSLSVIGSSAFQDCSNLSESLLLPPALVDIGQGAFRNCTGLTSVVLGSSLASIAQSAFSGCANLAAPSFPNSLAILGDSAFYGCLSLGGHLVFPSTVTSIGNYAFANTSAITSITLKATAPPAIFASTFASADASVPVYVPCGSLVSYSISDYWGGFASLAESAPFSLVVGFNDTLMGVVNIVQQPTCSDYSARIQAIASPGFRFVRWSDGAVANPRQVALTSDTSFVAIFVSDYSYVTVLSSDSVAGSVLGSGRYRYNDSVILAATASHGYHFQRWNDGNTSNPRLFFASQDTTFTAIFFSDTSTITAYSCNPTMGSVSGGGVYYYQNQAVVFATPFYGYHFTLWSDGLTDNPRTISVSQDSAFVANFAANTYNVSATSNSSFMGAVTGGGDYNYQTSATLSAVANLGYHFVKWSDGSTINPRTLTVLSDTSFEAQFAANSYFVSVAASDTAMGIVYGSGSYAYNSIVSISAVPLYGYHFVQWSDGNANNPRAVTVLGNSSFEAQFAINSYAVSAVSANPLWGSVFGGGSFAHGASTYLIATAAHGYHFTQWSDGNIDNPRLITVTQNAGYIAQFAANSYTVSVTSNNNSLGSTTGSGVYVYNSSVRLLATPFHGFYFARWSDGDTCNPRTFTVTGNVSLVAEFDSINYSLSTSSTNYAAGNVIGGGSYAYLSQATITAVPMPHYHFVQWTDSITTNPRVVTIIGDTLFTAQFALDTHSVSVLSADSVKGSVRGSGSWAYGTAVYLTAQPNYGYHFARWSDGGTQNPRRLVVASDTVLTAQFDYNVYDLSLSSNDTSLGVVSGGGSYAYLTSVSLVASPTGNGRFLSWSDGATDNPRTIVLTCDTVLVANFVSNSYTVSCNASDSSMGVVNGAGVYDYQACAILEAVPNGCCHFVSWSDGVTSNPRLVTVLQDSGFTAFFAADEQLLVTANCNDDSLGSVTGQGYYCYGSQAVLVAHPAEWARFVQWADGVTDNPRVVQVFTDIECTAVFANQTFTVSLTANDPAIGALYGAGEYAYCQQATLTAVPFPGAQFLCWSDSIADNPRTVVVTSDTAFYAIFRSLAGMDDVVASSCAIWTDRRTILVTGAGSRSVAVYDIYGRRVAFVAQEGELVVVPVGAAGVYLVQVEGLKAKKVVVM